MHAILNRRLIAIHFLEDSEVTDEQGQLRTPGDFIRAELQRREWGQDDLARVIGRPASRISEIMSGKLAVSPEIAAELAAALGGTAEQWLQRESAYRLFVAEPDIKGVQRRARIYQLAPIKEMQRRGWINETTDADVLEKEILDFFGISSLEIEPIISAVPRKTDCDSPLSSIQRAWCFRAKQLASSLVLPHKFNPSTLEQCEKELRVLAAYPQESRKIPTILARFGIRFIVVEPLANGKIDGAAFWLNDNSPVIALSVRFDRMDGLWFSLMHEFMHIKNRDSISVDADLVGQERTPEIAKPEIERRADNEASASLIKPDVLKNFIVRVGPMYSRQRIVQFAHTIKIHPAIIVGQLHHCGEVGYGRYRDLLAKVRTTVIQCSVTDGWGHSVHSEKLK
jgi:HTH-type transcriptional regulator/antitoxin HigA